MFPWTIFHPESALAAAARDAVRGLDPELPVYGLRSMAERVDASLARRRFSTLLLGLFAVLALTLGTIGTYGVMAYQVGQGTRELGIRLALGATPGRLLAFVLREGMALALAGVAVGLGAALLLTRAMRSLLFEVGAADPLTFLSVPARAARRRPRRVLPAGASRRRHRSRDVACEASSIVQRSWPMRNGCFVVAADSWPRPPGRRPRASATPRRASARRGRDTPAPAKVFTEADLTKGKPAGGRCRPCRGRDRGRSGGNRAEARREGRPRSIRALAALERERQERKLQEAEWRVRFAGAREQLALAEAACWHEVVRTRVLPGHPGPDEGEGVRRERGVPAGEAGPRRPRGAVPPHGPASRLGAPLAELLRGKTDRGVRPSAEPPMRNWGRCEKRCNAVAAALLWPSRPAVRSEFDAERRRPERSTTMRRNRRLPILVALMSLAAGVAPAWMANAPRRPKT